MIDQKRLTEIVLEKFPYKPTSNQKGLIYHLSHFILNTTIREIFILKGYAGTGKTSVVSAFVQSLHHVNKESVLLAPTGRAAKVFANYSGQQAFTIHKKIYFQSFAKDGSIRLVLNKNTHKNTVFLVDEASMIPDHTISEDGSLFARRSLLEDLLEYIFSGKNCSLVFIGDTAQLPPVGIELSPALDINYLKSSFNVKIKTIELQEVVRQSLESGILVNATTMREQILAENHSFKFKIDGFPDIFNINGSELEEFLHDNFGSGKEETLIITRSNKRANIFNREIRNRILFMESEISAGDLLMVVKNNYFWMGREKKSGFIANGDVMEILRIEKYEELYGFRFATVSCRFPDYPDENDLSVNIILDTLMVDGPALSNKDNHRFYEEVMKDYQDIPSKRKQHELLKQNPYFNALQVKYSYALTCHKTQGGQWENVFIDQGYFTPENLNTEYYRWLYTAVTRATQNVYLVNFHKSFF